MSGGVAGVDPGPGLTPAEWRGVAYCLMWASGAWLSVYFGIWLAMGTTAAVLGVAAVTSEGRAVPLRRVNIHDALPEDLKFIRGLVYTPTFVLVHEGREVGRILGYPGEDFFWGLLDQLIKRIPKNAKSNALIGPLPKPPSRDTKRPALRG